MAKKLQNIGASLLWLISGCIFVAQGYRAVMYYMADKPISWTWHDLVVFGLAFMAMFVPAKLKTMVVETANKMLNKKSGD